jgi:hypothetical protein
MKKRTVGILVYLFYVLCQLLNKFRYMVWEEIDFEILRSDLLLRLCDDWCIHKNLSLIFDFTRSRLGLQIGIFRIIAKSSYFPEQALQNCKSDMQTPQRGSLLFDRYGYGVLMKNFQLGLYIPLNIYTTKVSFIIQATFLTTEFSYYCFFRKF